MVIYATQRQLDQVVVFTPLVYFFVPGAGILFARKWGLAHTGTITITSVRIFGKQGSSDTVLTKAAENW